MHEVMVVPAGWMNDLFRMNFELARNVAEVVGIDSSETFVEVCLWRKRDSGLGHVLKEEGELLERHRTVIDVVAEATLWRHRDQA